MDRVSFFLVINIQNQGNKIFGVFIITVLVSCVLSISCTKLLFLSSNAVSS